MPVAHFGFVSLDDDLFTTGRFQDGLIPSNVTWAFSGTYAGFYYPVTLLSHMLDFQIFGNWAGGHHLTSLFLHLANTLALLAFLIRSTKQRWRSLIVAGLFALHPLHVESVAWVAERKDVLSTLFEFLALLAYGRYVERPSAGRFVPVILAFAMALMSKSMVVTFPFLLLLLDYWPFRRLDRSDASGGWGIDPGTFGRRLAEKIPLFALIPVSIALTLFSQKSAGAFPEEGVLTLGDRASNAILSFGRYMCRMAWPRGLVAYYPHPQSEYSRPLVLLTLGALLAATIVALWAARKYRFLPVGWFWYLGVLVPVIGFVQVGLQSSADRYTYVPLVGLFIVLVWGCAEILDRPTWVHPLAIAGIVTALFLSLALLARGQVMTWKTNEALYGNILRYYPVCPPAYVNLGAELGKQKRYEEASKCFETASKMTRLPVEARLNWGYALVQLERFPEAVDCLQIALSENPGATRGYFQLGLALSNCQRHQEAIPYYRKAYESKAAPAEAILWAGDLYRKVGLCQQAIEVYRIVAPGDPGFRAAQSGIAACAHKP